MSKEVVEGLLADSSKKTMIQAADLVLNWSVSISFLLDYLISPYNHSVKARILRVLRFVVEHKKDKQWSDTMDDESVCTKLIDNYSYFDTTSLKMGFYGFLQMVDCRFYQSKWGEVVVYAFDDLVAPTSSMAVKVYAMNVLYNIVQFEPELKNELYLSIELQLGKVSVGYDSHAKKVMKKIQKEKD